MRLRSLLPLALAIFVASIAAPVMAQSCPPGTAPATADDVQLMIDAGIKDAKVGTCWNKQDQSVGIADAQAKQYLISHYPSPGPCSRVGLPNPSVDGINRLDSGFAVELAHMLKAAPMQININSAYRTPQGQACANPRAPGSNHPKGCAVDLAYNQTSCSTAECQWVMANAKKYGLQIRMQYSPEWNHIEPLRCAGKSTGDVVTSGGSYLNTDDANPYTSPIGSNSDAPYYCLVSINPIVTVPSYTPPGPNCYNRQTPQTPYAASPLMQPAPTTNPASSPLGTASPATQTNTCTPSFSCSAGVMYYKTTQCTTQVYQVCSSSCNGNSCAAATSSTNTIGNAFSTTSSVNNTTTNVNADTSAATPTQSVSEILGAMANPFSATTIGTSSSIAFALNPETGDMQSLGADGAAIASASSSQGVGVISSAQPAGGQQTFTSGDLSQSGVSAGFQKKQTALAQILEGMKQALLWALSALTPFGGGTRR